MKEYKFERIKVKGVAGVYQKIEEYHEVIHESAKEGWELVQVFTPPTSFYGGAAFIEVIFSKDKE